MKLISDNNAVSFSIGFILTFSITSSLLIIVLLLFNNMMLHYGEMIRYTDYEVLGNNIGLIITSIDSIIAATQSSNGTINSLEYDLTIPTTIAGKTYYITISKNEILFFGNGIDRRVPLAIKTNIATSTISSGESGHKIFYNQTSKEIEVH